MARLTKEEIRTMFIHIPGWILADMNLSGNELIVYSVIYGFSQDRRSEFLGSLNYISDLIGISRQSVISVIDRLIAKNLVEKISHNNGDNSYRALMGSQETLHSQESLQGVVKKVDTPYTIEDINNVSGINNNTDNNKRKNNKESLVYPFTSEEFMRVWSILVVQPKWKKKTESALQYSLDKLGKYDEEFAIKLMEDAIERNWQGVVFDNTDERYNAWKNGSTSQNQPKTYPDGTYWRKNFTDEELKTLFQFDFELRQRLLQGMSIRRVNGKWVR